MKLSNKLKISFAVITVVPVFLVVLASYGIVKIKTKQVQNEYGVEVTMGNLLNPVELASKIWAPSVEYIEQLYSTVGGVLGDELFLSFIDSGLEKKNAFLVIKENSECVYGMHHIDADFFEKLSSISMESIAESGVYLGGDEQVVVKVMDVTEDAYYPITAYIVVKLKDLIPHTRRLIADTLIAILVVLVFISSIFIAWIRKETIKPINRLRLATENIKKGNLDFDIEVKGKDEIAELCRDFNNMKQRLKENAEEKIQRDIESRELISNISHDLKTPITSIKGYVEGIMDGVVDSKEKLDKYIKTIYNKACDMDRLIDELSFYSKIDSNKLPYNFTVININEYFEDCVDDLSAELESEGFGFTYDNRIVENAYTVADAEQLKRVINNIVSNSVKYMDDKRNKLLAIKLYEDDEWIHISIEDNGSGIPEKDLPNIFNRFYRADSSRNSSRGGSGIGLSIVQKIIEDHGGKINASSIYGEGTTMTIDLIKYVKKTPEIARIS